MTEVAVKGYVSAVLSKLNAAERTQAALMAVRYGLISDEDLPAAYSFVLESFIVTSAGKASFEATSTVLMIPTGTGQAA